MREGGFFVCGAHHSSNIYALVERGLKDELSGTPVGSQNYELHSVFPFF